MISSLVAIAAIAGFADGPISKFAARPVVADYDSTSTMEDIERCLIMMDAGAPPTVYKQDDRPNETMLIWMKVGDYYGVPGARLDLQRIPTGTHVRSWMPAKQALDCAPRAG